MLNEIIEGISLQLNRVFGDGYPVYQNEVAQGLEEPCFFIAVLKPEVSPLLGRRAMLRNPFVVQYFPTDPGQNEEMYQVAERLTEALEFITLRNGDLLHGIGMSYEAVDGVLHFFVSYHLPLIRPVEQTNMETLEALVDTEQKG